MQENRVLYSDASFDINTKKASVSVYDIIADEYTTQVYEKIPNILIAETMALKFAVSVAIIKNYTNIVFVYDNISIDTENIKKEFSSFFEMMQFLWLKREFLNKVDKSAKIALKEAFSNEKNPKKTSDTVQLNELIKTFKTNVFNKEEIKLIENWENRNKNPNDVINKTINFTNFRAFYSLIKNENKRNEFYNVLKFYYPKVLEFKKFRIPLNEKACLKLINLPRKDKSE